MPSQLHQIDDLSELLEVFFLRRPQPIRPEERDDHITEVRSPRDSITAELVSMIVMSPIVSDMATSKELCQFFQNITASSRLYDRKIRLHLPAESRGSVSKDGAAETAFPIDKAGNPSAMPESFLLVFRTHRVFT
jgi:hypothetical protein